MAVRQYGADCSIGSTLALVLHFKAPGFSAGKVDISTLSNSTRIKTFMDGWGEWGEAEIQLLYTGQVFENISALIQTTQTISFTMADDGVLSGSGFISGLELDDMGVNDDDKATFTVRVQPVGTMSFSYSST